MQLITVVLSFIILACARPVPQDVPNTNSTEPTSPNSTTTISVQDALSLLSAGNAASATSAPASSLAHTLATSTSAASVGPTAATDTGSATLPSATLVRSNLITIVSSSSLPSATSLTDDGSDSNSTATLTADLSTLSVLSTASIDNNTSSVTATLSSATAINTSISYLFPTDIPQACMAKVVPIMSASSVITASVADTTAFSYTGVASDSSSFSNDSATLTESVSALTNNVSATATSLTGFALLNASATILVPISSTLDPLISGNTPTSTAIATFTSATGTTPPANAPTATASDTAPLQLVKRIAQDDLPDVAQSWQDLCLVSGGDIFTNEPCVTLAGVNGINALLADADPCAQQDNADAMIDFAKSAGVINSADLIANAVAYRQHARNAFSVNGIIPSTPYCQKAAKNEELNGLVNAQLPAVNAAVFGGPSFGLVAFGDPSSCPFGATPDTDSCDCVSSK